MAALWHQELSVSPGTRQAQDAEFEFCKMKEKKQNSSGNLSHKV